jgi:amidohydrolase
MNDQVIAELKKRIKEVLPEVTDLRHRIHSEPEIGVDTPATAAKIRHALKDTSADVWKPLLGNDVVGEIKVDSSRTICLRADIDALPIFEDSDLPYKSTIPGCMHACGHDGHASMLVGAIKVLDSMKEHLPVSVRFVFQPGEEVVGAGKPLVEAGACDGCDSAYAIHGWPGLPAGLISAKEGVMMAAGVMFTFTIKGKGCHGARPNDGRNPVPVAARIISELTAMHDRVNRDSDSVVSICSVRSGNNSNVIPDTAVIQGTARYLSVEVGDVIEKEIRSIVHNACRDAGVEAEIEYELAYGQPVINTKKGYELIKRIAQEYVGSWCDTAKPSMGSEDFSYYLIGREGALLNLGLGENMPGLHASTFNFNDAALETGILVHCLTVLMQ